MASDEIDLMRVLVELQIDAPDGADARNVRAFVSGLLPYEHPWCPRITRVTFPWDTGPNAPTPIVPPLSDEGLPSTRRQGEAR